MASASAPAAAAASRRKRPMTYGKQSRSNAKDLPYRLEAFNQAVPHDVPSELPSVSSPPKTAITSTALEAKAKDVAKFDVPSSDDDEPQVKRPKVRSVDKISKKNDITSMSNKPQAPIRQIARPNNITKRTAALHEKTRVPTTSSQDVQAAASRTDSTKVQDYLENHSKTHYKKKRKLGDALDEYGELRVAGNALALRKSPMAQHKKIKASEKGRVDVPKRKQDNGRTEINLTELRPVDKFDLPNHANQPPLDPMWDISTSNTEDDSKDEPGRPRGKTPKKRKHNKIGQYEKTSRASPHLPKTRTERTRDRRPKSPVTRPMQLDEDGRGDLAKNPSTPVPGSPMTETSGNVSPHNMTPMQTTRNSTPLSQRRGVTTPRQSKLWSTLLNGDTTTATPSRDFGRLDLNQRDRLVSEDNDAGNACEETPRRKRLIDALLPSALPSSEDPLESDASSMSDPESQNDDTFSKVAEEDAFDVLASSQPEQVMNSTSSQPQLSQNTTGGPKFTYGGHRTHLADSNDTLETMLAQPFNIDTSPMTVQPRGDQTKLGRKGAGAGAATSDDEEDGTKAVRTIHDLRAGGDVERFIDEVSEIVDDLDSNKSSISRKRSALLELCQKLGDSVFRTRFVHSGYESRTFSLCSSESDPVVGSAAAAAMILILGPDDGLCNTSDILDAGMFTTLSYTMDYGNSLKSIAKDRRTNMSRIAQSSVERLSRQMTEYSVWNRKGLYSISPMSLALCALELLIRKLRESGNMQTLLERSILDKLLNILALTLEKLEHSKLSEVDAEMLGQLEVVLSILESCTTVSACALDKILWDEQSLDTLVNLLDAAMSVPMPRERSTQRLIPRLSLNLANNNERTSRKFATGSFIRLLVSRILAEFDLILGENDGPMDLDVLLLSLGAMLNLAECSDDIRQTVIAQGNDLLDSLIKVFLRGRKQAGEADSLAASQANVAYGWLAVLLGNLCQNVTIRKHVRKALPGDGLDALVEAVDEFIMHHEEADKTAQSNEAYVTFTKRLQSVAQMLRGL